MAVVVIVPTSECSQVIEKMNFTVLGQFAVHDLWLQLLMPKIVRKIVKTGEFSSLRKKRTKFTTIVVDPMQKERENIRAGRLCSLRQSKR